MWWRLIFTNNAESANIKLRDSDDEEFSFEFFHFVCMALWAGKSIKNHKNMREDTTGGGASVQKQVNISDRVAGSIVGVLDLNHIRIV